VEGHGVTVRPDESVALEPNRPAEQPGFLRKLDVFREHSVGWATPCPDMHASDGFAVLIRRDEKLGRCRVECVDAVDGDACANERDLIRLLGLGEAELAIGTREEGSWTPRSLIDLDANPPEPPTIGGLLYPAKRTLLSGETESLKTWLGLILAKAEMDIGLPVAWVDLDAMGSAALLERLRALGVTDEKIDSLFAYYEPAERLIDDVLTEVCDDIATRGNRLFVIDAFNPMLSLHGLDPSSTPDIETFWREVATPITVAGAAPTLLDHVTKNPDSRGKYSYGSERKASGATVHIGFKLLDAFARGATGRALLTTHKDRPGYLPRPVIGQLVLESDGELVTYTLKPDRSHAGDKFRPTNLMEKVSTSLAAQDKPVPRGEIETGVTGSNPAIRTAIDVLIEEGYARQTDGPHGAKLVEHVRRYREADDQFEPTESSSSQPRPNLVLELVSKPSRDLVPSSPLRRTRTRTRIDLVQSTSSPSLTAG
jgi:hypothetical protein